LLTTEDLANPTTAPASASDTINQPLETSEISLDEAQELVHIGTWQWEVSSGDISWSAELYRIYGLRPRKQAVSFEEFVELIHPDDREKVTGIINDAYQTKRPFEFEHRIVLPNKKIRILEGKGKVVTDAKGNVSRMFGTSQDITERKKSDQALYRSDERFRAVSAATNDIVYDVDLQSNTAWFNDALNSEYKYRKRKAPYARQWGLNHVHPDDRKRIKASLNELLSGTETTWVAEYKFRKRDGTYTDVRDRAFLLRDSDQKPLRLIGSMLDITQQKELERAKDRFISLVSHQLRTSLTSMRLLAEMLANGQPDSLTAAQQDYVQQIECSTERMINLVNEILDLSNIESGRLHMRMSDTDINTLIQSQIDEVAPLGTERGIKVVFKPDPKIRKVVADPTLFSQIVHNLITNAIRYTLKENASVHVTFRRTEKEYLLTVQDEGIGVPKEAWPRLFTSFYRANNAIKTHGDGSGLGLYLAKLILDMTGGKIWFESEEGKGSTFYVSLPLTGMHSA
jgi:PAS domain S-box-containing protein